MFLLTMVLWDTVGVGAAGEGGAWVGALVVGAGQLAGAVVVLLALGRPGRLSDAAADVGVSLGPDRALALVAARTVDADGALLARVVKALVHVLAAGQRAPGVARVAEALWRVGGRALGVEAAAEAVAGALAAVAVELVHVEGRRADARAPLALLVLLGGHFDS